MDKAFLAPIILIKPAPDVPDPATIGELPLIIKTSIILRFFKSGLDDKSLRILTEVFNFEILFLICSLLAPKISPTQDTFLIIPLGVYSSGIILKSTDVFFTCSIMLGGPTSPSPKIKVGDKDNKPSLDKFLT